MTLQRTMMWVSIVTLCLLTAVPGNAQTAKQRNFMLVFEVTDYSAQVKEAVEYFIENVFQKGDNLIVITPKKLMGFSPDKLNVPKKKFSMELLKTLKADINTGMASYRTAMDEMMRTVTIIGNAERETSSSPVVLLEDYKKNRQNLAALRGNLEEKLLKYAKIFRPTKGTQFENHLVMILEKESRPIPDKESLEDFRNTYKDYSLDAQEVFLEEKAVYQPPIDFKKLEAAFKYANVKFHLLYVQSKQIRSRDGIDYTENTGEIYKAFADVTDATGGVKMTTSTPSSFFKKVEQVLEGKVTVEVVDENVKNE